MGRLLFQFSHHHKFSPYHLHFSKAVVLRANHHETGQLACYAENSIQLLEVGICKTAKNSVHFIKIKASVLILSLHITQKGYY